MVIPLPHMRDQWPHALPNSILLGHLQAELIHLRDRRWAARQMAEDALARLQALAPLDLFLLQVLIRHLLTTRTGVTIGPFGPVSISPLGQRQWLLSAFRPNMAAVRMGQLNEVASRRGELFLRARVDHIAMVAGTHHIAMVAMRACIFNGLPSHLQRLGVLYQPFTIFQDRFFNFNSRRVQDVLRRIDVRVDAMLARYFAATPADTSDATPPDSDHELTFQRLADNVPAD